MLHDGLALLKDYVTRIIRGFRDHLTHKCLNLFLTVVVVVHS